MRPTSFLALWLVVAPACSSSTDNPTPVTDAATDAPPADAPPADTPSMRQCGDARPEVSTIRGTEGLVIGPDGTIYYSQSRAVGRMRPGMAPEPAWAMLPSSATTVWGLAFDRPRNRLYVGSPMNGTIYAVALDSGAAEPFVTGAGAANGLTIGPDGALWYTDFQAGRVYRVDESGMRAQVTTRAVASANGLAFGPDGNLYVDSYSAGTVVRLTLAGNMETGRETVATGLGNPDGIAFDARGRIYVTDNGGRRLVRLDADGSNPTVLLTGVGAAASLDFGAGALNCNDIYVASSGAVRRYEEGDAQGANVPWH